MDDERVEAALTSVEERLERCRSRSKEKTRKILELLNTVEDQCQYIRELEQYISTLVVAAQRTEDNDVDKDHAFDWDDPM